jgi:hypothetical protein
MNELKETIIEKELVLNELMRTPFHVEGYGQIVWSTLFPYGNDKKAVATYIIKNIKDNTSIVLKMFVTADYEPLNKGNNVYFLGNLKENTYNNESKGLEVIASILNVI